MMNLSAIFTILLVIQHFSNLVFATSSIDESSIDRVALLAIKSQITHDSQGVMSSWNDSLQFCQWQGVTCGAKLHQRRRVVSLSLSFTGLVGTLSPFVGNLSFLHRLQLDNNSLQGHIPSQIGHLSRLRYLVLEMNSFEGEIPANISRCLNLKLLGLAINHLSGAIPPELGLLSSLEGLSLQENRLTGNPLNIVMNMTSLQVLSARSNSFQGSIPDEIGQRTNLTFISLGQSQLSGTIPPSFYNLSSLQVIDFTFNRLEGSLPVDVGLRFPQITDFKISGNFFHGHVPISLSNLTQLQLLDIYSNSFTGKFMFSAENMPNLNWIDISLNYIGTGGAGDLSFLKTLANCSQLQVLELGSNNLGGALPYSIGNLSTELTGIDFHMNQITGTIPSWLFDLVNLEQLTLDQNHLTGYLPSQIGLLTQLVTFSCHGNNLSGNIPYSLGNLSRLGTLYLDNNNFQGMIPSSLGNCTNLVHMSLLKNRLTGPLPPHMFHASMLVDLNLGQNNLQGTVPVDIGQLRNLVLLDISANAFSGEVPIGLASCTGLLEFYAGGNIFSGSIPQSFKSLTSLRYLNLSHNRLSGEIPNFLSGFPLKGLDLSYNNLEGEVPRKGAFANASALLVSGNSKLCGGIPELHLPRCPASAPTRGYKKRRKLSHILILIIVAACFVCIVSIISSIYLVCFRKKKKLSKESSMSKHLPKVSYDMIQKATNGFCTENLVGSGHFGCVYKGVLDPMSMVVAIKVINLGQQGANKTFMAECQALKNIRHRNLLKVVTACSSTDFQGNDFKALVYEFMSNGNLQQWIHMDREMVGLDEHRQTLSLLQRLNIAIDIACALDYLHNSCEDPIIHCDLKPANILFDNDMVAHVGDFGLARFHSYARTRNSSSLAVTGTVGYTAPEYGLGSKVSKEGDIYSYGIVLIEIMTAKRPTDDTMCEGSLNLHQYAKSAFPYKVINIIDPRLLDGDAGVSIGNQDKNHQDELLTGSDSSFECIKSVIEIGVKCSAESPQDRMSIENAIKELQSTRDTFVGARHQYRNITVY